MIKIVTIVVLIGVAYGNLITKLSSSAAPDDLTSIGNVAKIAIEKIPYHVSWRARDFHFCSGTIISKDWILTAAACTLPGYRSYSIRAGSSYTNIGGSIHNVSRVIPHENFTNDPSFPTSHDIALVQLATPLTIDATRQPIKLYESGEKTNVGSAAVLSGYGTVRYDSQKPKFLLIQNVTIISKDQCKKDYSYLAPESPSQICSIFSEDDMDYCHDDPGGPVTVDGRLTGVVSRGMGCPDRGRPLVYTDVAYFRDWIKEKSGI